MSSVEPIYAPPWLERLRDIDPAAAALFDTDPKRTTKLDTMLAGVADTETKLSIIRTALNAGVDPQDPAIAFTIMALGINKLVGADFHDMIEAAKRSATSGAAIVEQIRLAGEGIGPTISSAIDGAADDLENLLDQSLGHIKSTTDSALQQVADTSKQALAAISLQTSTLSSVATDAKESLAALPEAARALVERIEDHGREAVTQHAAKYASHTVAEASKQYSEAALADLRTATIHITEVLEALKPTRLLVERLKETSSSVILGLKITARERTALMSGAVFGMCIGFVLFGFVANTTHFGLSPELIRSARAGDFYLQSFTRISQACRAEFQKIGQSH